ncbi:MAG: FAD-dependent oxidoreductase, partial [Verrucomicrobia bacterium]|nr:FAD-dependent oxidoreductase [Verrucomicrobiota bacterium]
TDSAGKPAGVVMDNRAGRQAILAKVVIDATPNARLAKAAGASLSEFRAGPQNVSWTVIATNGPGAKARKLPVGFIGVLQAKRDFAVDAASTAWFEYSLKLELPDASWAARARIEQAARDASYNPSQIYSPEMPFALFPQTVVSGVPGLLVLTEQPRPLATMRDGEKLGGTAAEQAKKVKLGADLRVAVAAPKSEVRGKIMEPLAPLRPTELEGAAPSAPRATTERRPPGTISQAERDLPVLGEYDVVVVGGGTAGAPAGIGAARRGARTLVIEYAGGLGGVGTIGGIAAYYCGNRVGFTETVPPNPTEVRMEWYRSELRKAGAEIWFGCSGVGAVVDGNRIKGVVVVTPYGRGVVFSPTVVDATGNADIAIAAGAKYVFIEEDYALQNSHVPLRTPGRSYVNGDIPATDDADPMHVRLTMRAKLERHTHGFDLGTVIASRERRRIVGDFTLDWLDSMNQRTFPDTVTLAMSDYDSHGYQIHPYFTLTMPERRTKFWANVPYRCILPQGLEGVLVVGLAMSAHRDVMPITRMQPDLHNLGYAAGVAAAMAVKANVTPRAVDVKALQKHLVEVGNLKASVLTDRDSYPILADRVRAAVANVVKEYKDAEVLLAMPEMSRPLLQAAYKKASGLDKTVYAHVLAAMGDNTGVPTLLEALRTDKLPIVRFSKGNGGRWGIIRAIGLTRDRRAVPLLLELSKSKEVKTDFQLRRSLVLTLGRIGDPVAIPVLVEMLGTTDGASPAIADLLTASALYRCGDTDGKARRWLEACARQSDGTMARLAQQTLSEKK